MDAPTPADTTATEEPLIDSALWRSEEADHHGKQYRQWDDAWHKMSERQKAAALEHIYLEILWDDLDQGERDKALERIREDREWPGRYVCLEADERARREREAEEQRARDAALKRDLDEMGRRIRKMREQAEADAKAARERQEREEREAEEERQRLAEEERQRLQRERDELADGVVGTVS